jgi:5'-nucleotidase
MNIFLTNDDGIDSPGFLDFARALRSSRPGSVCRVFVIAPDANRSGISHALTALHGPLHLKKREEDTWSCSGSPADCAGIAIMGGLGELSGQEPFKPDLVIAGINAGANLGTDLLFSGTAAAARHAALYAIPGLALSLAGRWRDGLLWENAISYAVSRIDAWASLWRPDTFVNVNMPNSAEPPLGECITFPSIRQYTDSINFKTDEEGLSCLVRWGDILTRPAEGSDGDAVEQGYVSVSSIYIHPLTPPEDKI